MKNPPKARPKVNPTGLESLVFLNTHVKCTVTAFFELGVDMH